MESKAGGILALGLSNEVDDGVIYQYGEDLGTVN